MKPSPALRQQSHTKIRSEIQRMKNEHNIKQAEPKLSKVMSSLHISNKDVENKDPTESRRKPPSQPGVSFLPVLAKSLNLRSTSEFKESYSKWEEKPLAGKAKKKSCTRPVPFNFSQPKSTKRVDGNREPLTAPQSRTRANHPEPSASKTIPNKHRDVLKSGCSSVKGLCKSNEKAAVNTAHLSGKPSPKLKTSAPLYDPLFTSGNKVKQNVSIPPARTPLHPRVGSDLPGGKDPLKTTLPDQIALLTTQASRLKPLNDKSENFQPDPAASMSILKNKGPQRVLIMKSQQKDSPITGPMRSVPFSPDPSALQSILQNKGVTAVGAMQRNSVCPPGRNTSIWSAQRVPVKKSCSKSTSRSGAAQRVHNIGHHPMSAMKCHPSPYDTLGQKSYKSNIHSQVGVVQRLFDDPEDEQGTAETAKNPRITEQTPVPASSDKPPSEVKSERCESDTDDDDDEDEEHKAFLQAPPRESVIFFSTGKKLIRAPRFETQEGSDQQDPVSSEQNKFATAHGGPSEPAHHIHPAVQQLHKDVITRKPCSLNPVAAMLRKRLPPLEELLIEEEVASYTSVSVPADSGSAPRQPRCRDPVASVLHFEDSTRFVPIGFELLSGPSSVHLFTPEEMICSARTL
ncbi:uncharacterized protein troap [Fundulus heteroclitus]|uniref:uncharacterized protein troap n=1 Tax=Fundulus heteroclitus TaxID=8078 RepID=UPI00165B043D|nr:uncharacterized protein troap [Fundulus heteroclitus]